MVSHGVERVCLSNLSPAVNSQLLHSECAARESTNEDEIMLTCGRVKNIGLAHSVVFYLFHFPNERVSNRPLQCTLAHTTEVFTIFLSFYK